MGVGIDERNPDLGRGDLMSGPGQKQLCRP